MLKKLIFIFVLLAGSTVGTVAGSLVESFAGTLAGSHYAADNGVVMGADRMDVIKNLVKQKRIGLIANQTSVLNDGTHLLDALIAEGLDVKKIFAPEHGFRGTENAGSNVKNEKDSKTGIMIVSLYGNNYKPSAKQLADIDVVIFDIQDVGARFYTYISTLHYAMEACAENNKEMIVLDRPNPNDYVDGPVRKDRFKSFVGVDPLPTLHGLTVGELARMINGELWTKSGKCTLSVVPMRNWKHGQYYSLPVKPSPNLPNDAAIRLYPSLCFFEGTCISVARGTQFPFQALGYPDKKYGDFTFTPQPLKDMETNPQHKGKKCYGVDLRSQEIEEGMTLKYLLDFYVKSGKNAQQFFQRAEWFDLLAGTDMLRQQIINGLSEDEIRDSWQDDLEKYSLIRQKYLIYEDY